MRRSMFARFLPMLEVDGAGMGTGAEAQEFTDPGSEEGVEDQEFTDPDDEDDEDFYDDTEDIQEEPEERDLERDAAFAGMRRELEEARDENERLAGEVESYRSWFEQEVQGRINPYTDEPIESIEEYNEYLYQYQQDQLQRMGLPADYIDQAINNHPVVKAAQQMMQRQEQARIDAMFGTELENIRKLNPDIQTMDDLTNMEDYDIFESLIRGGMHIDTAYRRIHEMRHPQIAKKTDTKSHLKRTDGSGGSDSYIPKDQMKLYKALNPGATEKEIRAFHNKQMRRKEK